MPFLGSEAGFDCFGHAKQKYLVPGSIFVTIMVLWNKNLFDRRKVYNRLLETSGAEGRRVAPKRDVHWERNGEGGEGEMGGYDREKESREKRAEEASHRNHDTPLTPPGPDARFGDI